MATTGFRGPATTGPAIGSNGRMIQKRVRVSIVSAALASAACLATAGVATASPLLDPPRASTALSESPEIDGAVHSTTTKPVGRISEAATREELRYGTGVSRGGVAEVGTMTVFTPDNPDGRVLTYIPATDSLYAGDAPSKRFDSGEMSDKEADQLNAALADGVTVIVPDAYGDLHPQYAGQWNGVRITNAVEAYRNDPSRAPITEVTCYGFSGGGIDCARVGEYRHSQGRFDTVVVDSGPTDLARFLEKPGVQNGLGWSALVGAERSMTVEQRTLAYAKLRPSAIVFIKGMSLLGDAVPVPGLVAGVATYAGVLLPLPLEVAGQPGMRDDPEVIALLEGVSPTTPETPFAGRMVFRYNDRDRWVPPSVHMTPLADRYRDQGTDVVEVTNDGQMAPGHEPLQPDELVGYLNADVPVDGTRTHSAPLTPVEQAVDDVLTGAIDGVAAYGQVLTEHAPPVLDAIDQVLVTVDSELDRQNR